MGHGSWVAEELLRLEDRSAGVLQEEEGVSDTSLDPGAHRVTAEETPRPPQPQLGVCLAPFTV